MFDYEIVDPTVAPTWHSKRINHQHLKKNYIFMELMNKTAEFSIKTAELILIPRKFRVIKY